MDYAAVSRKIVARLAAAAFVALAATQGALAQDERALAQAYNASGQDLFRRFSGEPGNIVFSPYSIGTAMAMALAGARGDTERDMASALRQTLGRAQMDAANGKLIATLNGYDKSAVTPDCPQGLRLDQRRCVTNVSGDRCPYPAEREGNLCVATPRYPASATLSVANALMLTGSGALVAPAYVALVKDKYAAEVFRGVSLADVNDWVKAKTQGKIEKILDQLDPSDPAVILNAVYFKAKWASTFSKNATTDDAFHLTRTQTVRVPTMRKSGSLSFATRNGYRAVRLPYDVNALGMVIVLPDEIDGLAQVGARLDANELGELFAALRASNAFRAVELSLPRFKVTYRANLAQLFAQAGMARAFDPKRADFSGMTGRPLSQVQFAISQIVHRAVIDVMEDGTEAAAATAVVMMAATASPQRPQYEPFRVDRPFLYYVVDQTTGAVLFQGRVVDPR